MISDAMIVQALQLLLIAAGLLVVAVAAVVGEHLINWLDRRDADKMRTASRRQIARDVDALLRQAPSGKGPLQEPWRDTMPPAAQRVRAGPGKVVTFPTAGAEHRRMSP